ncbi:MAG: CbiX/SirB N-terminal domain-containing protein [Planctomycetaceae bacterium]
MNHDDSKLKTGVILVDHGSRREASNQQLLESARLFHEQSDWEIVEPAHMELAEPSIAQAMAKCVEAGAEKIVVFPWFLAPGRHWAEDIPRLVNEAAAQHPNLKTLVTAPFGNHSLLVELANHRINHCLEVEGTSDACSICNSASRC